MAKIEIELRSFDPYYIEKSKKSIYAVLSRISLMKKYKLAACKANFLSKIKKPVYRENKVLHRTFAAPEVVKHCFTTAKVGFAKTVTPSGGRVNRNEQKVSINSKGSFLHNPPGAAKRSFAGNLFLKETKINPISKIDWSSNPPLNGEDPSSLYSRNKPKLWFETLRKKMFINPSIFQQLELLQPRVRLVNQNFKEFRGFTKVVNRNFIGKFKRQNLSPRSSLAGGYNSKSSCPKALAKKKSRFLKNFTIKTIYLKTKKRKYTVIRSPHIHKKSREQFEWKQYKRRIVIFTADLSFYLELLSILKRMVLPGASIQIFLKFKTFFPFAAKQSLAAPTK